MVAARWHCLFAATLTLCSPAKDKLAQRPCSIAKAQEQSPSKIIQLSKDCPAGLEKKADGLCYYRTGYHEQNHKSGLLQAVHFKKNGLKPQVIDLGRLLFFDPLLSGDQSISCAHCHHPSFGLSDGRSLSMGAGGCGVGKNRTGGTVVPRSAPGLWNAALYELYFWDGRAATLEDQARGPLFSAIEMKQTPAGLQKALEANPDYRRLFRQAFGRRGLTISVDIVLEALADFERTLISFNSRYDQYVQGNKSALTAFELKGFNVFRSFVTRCAECHPPPLFTTNQTATIGAPDLQGRAPDPGREALTGQTLLRGDFKIPTLRNIARNAPYMHSGALANLEEVVDFYNQGGGRARGLYGELQINWHVREIGLGNIEKEALVAFLKTLDDETNLPQIPAAVPSGLPVLE